MSGQGYAVMGTAVASGSNRAIDAANRAINSPLLEDNCINGAQGILINVTGSSSLSLQEVHEASSIIQKAAHENANIIFGAVHGRCDEGVGEDHGDRRGLPRSRRQKAAHAAVVSAEDVEGRTRSSAVAPQQTNVVQQVARNVQRSRRTRCRRTISTCPHSCGARRKRRSAEVRSRRESRHRGLSA